jgi:ribose transport system substrate-binding protein
MNPQAPSGAKTRSALPRNYAVKSVMRAATILKTFKSKSEILELRTVATRSQLNKATAFRLSETLVEAGLLDRLGHQGYRLRIEMQPSRRFRIGYGAQSNVVPFTATVTDSIKAAADAANTDLLILNNNFSSKTALLNADRFVREKVDLVINSQIDFRITAEIAAKFSDAQIPFIALDMPHPGAFYFGADNYKAGRMAGRYLAKWTQKFWDGEANEIIQIGADLGGHHLRSRLTGLYNGLLEILPHLRSVPCTYVETKGQFDKTLDEMRKYLRRRKIKRALVCAVNDTSALAALQAFRELAIEKECAIAGQDACMEAREEMRRSSTHLVCSVAYFPENYGSMLIKIVKDILSERQVPPAIFTQHELVTPANLDRVYPNDIWMNAPQQPARNSVGFHSS